MSLLEDFNVWFEATPDADVATVMGVYPSMVKRWRSKKFKVPLEKVSLWNDTLNASRPVPESNDLDFNNADLLISALKNLQAKKTIEPKILDEMRNCFFRWHGKSLSILFPCYKYTNPATAWVLTALALDLGRDKVRFDMELGDAMIYHSRNSLADRFLATDCEWSLWLDDDMVPPIGRSTWFKTIGRLPANFPEHISSQHVVERLMSHGKSIVGSCYFGRQQGGYPIFAERAEAEPRAAAYGMRPEIRKTQWVGTGCLLVHRKVYEDIKLKMPELAPSGARKVWDFFLPTHDGGEDVAFCKRAAEAGHQVWVDTGCQSLHIGYAAYHAMYTQQTQ